MKSRVQDAKRLRAALNPLVSNIERIRRGGNADVFAGLFAFESGLAGDPECVMDTLLEELRSVSRGQESRVIDFVCLGSSHFVLYWEGDKPEASGHGQRWHAYYLPDMAAGYFVNNVVFASSPASVARRLRAWFPKDPKKRLGLAKS